jgi:hypothetical protein
MLTMRGLDILPTVHIGAVANAMEQKGIQTDRGNINREIEKHNHFVRVAKNEIIDMVHKITDRYGVLKLPVLLWG